MLTIQPIQEIKKGAIIEFLSKYSTHLYSRALVFRSFQTNSLLADLLYDYEKGGSVFIVSDQSEIEAIIAFRNRDWDTEYFGYKSASLDHLYVRGGERVKGVIKMLSNNLDKWLEKNGIRLISTKVFPQKETIELLKEKNFNFLLEEYVLTKTLPDQTIPLIKDDKIRSYREKDRQSIIDIIKSVKWQERFHFSKEKADGMYLLWFTNSLGKNNVHITVLESEDHKAVGFTIWSLEKVFFGKEEILLANQELVAVHPEMQGQGWGARLYMGTLMDIQEAGAHIVKTTISAENIPAIKNHKKLKFEFDYKIAVYHKFCNL